MSRRRAAAVLAAVFAFAAQESSRPASAADEAASVNGESISIDDFEAAVEASGGVDANGIATAAAARSALTGLIAETARAQFLRAHGTEPEEGAIADQLGRLVVRDVSDLADAYATRPASLGVICARMFPVADVASGDDAVAALAGGTPIADVAAEYSVDPQVADVDVWLTRDPAQPCAPLTEFQFDATVASAFTSAGPGEPIGPVSLAGAQGDLTFVAELAAFDEVASAIEAMYTPVEGQSSPAGELLFRGWFLDAEVSVNPRYGRWDQTSATIVPLSQP